MPPYRIHEPRKGTWMSLLALESRQPVALLFAGQGAQHPRMAAGLYGQEESFSSWMDHAFRLFEDDGPRLRAEWLAAAPSQARAALQDQTSGVGDLGCRHAEGAPRHRQPAVFPVRMMTADFLDHVRSFVHAEITSKTDYFDGLPEPPTSESAGLQEAGLANWWIPATYGGRGVSLEDSVDIVSELASGDAGFAFGSFLSILGTTMLQLCGEETLARPHLEKLARDGGVCGILVSEEQAGSALGRITTTYTRHGGNVIVNGDKYFATNVDAAEVLLVVGRSSEDDAISSVILVPRDVPGLEIVKRWNMVGIRGSATYQVRLRDCAVAAENCLRGNGLRNLEIGLNASRILIASTAIGMARRVRDLSMEYAAVKQVKAPRWPTTRCSRPNWGSWRC
jgi:alkylation response protein AidB-like acyl-CoA dehydrogenase